ncbi:MAG: hypothetical protein A2W22_04020 [Candidatus Levybacteria bacterium RBG_16_35_11]|nr:MAG: hypothetical protein A2W22_04020 [Candidatus Levybacteria bacterium RBG_16_35_11]
MPRVRKEKLQKKNGSRLGIRWGESYISLLLGIVVVVVAFVLVFTIVRNKNYNVQTTSSVDTEETGMKALPKSYEVKSGDDLWKISEKIYGSGYNWVDLAKTNNIKNPDIIFSGTKLSVPNVKPKIVKTDQLNDNAANAIKSDTYKVQKGDYLWEIAVRAYGDGFKWVDIAKKNNLTNPDLIFSGNVLKIPR